MILRDYHTHTVFSDGANTPEEMVRAALEKGMTAIGFSEHSYTSFDPAPCMLPERTEAYRREIQRLKEVYAGQIRILCGIEQDCFSDTPAEGCDYIIGSVHYVQSGDAFVAVDDTPELLLEGVERHFGGDIYLLTDAYWEAVSTVIERTGADIIGHLDLVRKFNRDGRFFDENDPRYLSAAFRAIDRLLETGKPFEINTGAISRGYQDTPYPAPVLIDYIRTRGGKFILSSDSHRAETLCYGFETWEAYADPGLTL